jgi:predicted ATPase
MAIQKLEVSGFRSLRQATWEPGKLNLLVGPNAGGKSNVLRCLELISQTARGNLAKTMSEGEGMVPLMWDHQPGIVRWKLRIDSDKRNTAREHDALIYVVALKAVGSGYEIVEDALANWQVLEQNAPAKSHWLYKRDQVKARFFDENGRIIFDARPNLLYDPQGYDPAESILQQVFGDATDIDSRRTSILLRNWAIHDDVSVGRASKMRRPATTQHTTRLVADGGNLATVLHTLYTNDRSFREAINDGMRAGFGDQFERLEFPPAAAQQIQLAVQWKTSTQPHVGSDLSDGTLRFLFLLTVFSHPDPPALIAIDEPETGLNPSMLPVVAEYAQAASARTQVVLTSHSPEFLDAFTDMAPHVTVCHWEDGETLLYPLAPDAISTWLEKYRLGHLFLRGELETIALPPVEPLENGDERFADLPSEDEMMHSGDRGSEGDA